MTDPTFLSLWLLLKAGHKSQFVEFLGTGLYELYKDLVKFDARFKEDNASSWKLETWKTFFGGIIGRRVIYSASNFFTNSGNSRFINNPEELLTLKGRKLAAYHNGAEEDSDDMFNPNLTNANQSLLDQTIAPPHNLTQTTSQSKAKSGNAEKILAKAKDQEKKKDLNSQIEDRFERMKSTFTQTMTKSLDDGFKKLDSEIQAIVKEEVEESEKIKEIEKRSKKASSKAAKAEANATKAVETADKLKADVEALDAGLTGRIKETIRTTITEMISARAIEGGVGGMPELLAIEGVKEEDPNGMVNTRRFNQAKIARAEYRKAIFNAISEGRIRIQVVDNTRYMTGEGDVWNVKGENLRRDLGVPALSQITFSSRKDRNNALKFTIYARVDVAFSQRAEVVKRILRERNKHAGKLGLSLLIPEEYDISSLLYYYKKNLVEEGYSVINNFDLTKNGFLAIYLNDQTDDSKEEFKRLNKREPTRKEACTVVMPACPKQFALIKEMTYANLLRLADFNNFYAYEGGVFPVPREKRTEVHEPETVDIQTIEEGSNSGKEEGEQEKSGDDSDGLY